MATDLSAEFPLYIEDEFALLGRCVAVRGRRVLDIGCGKGEMSRRLALEGGAARVVGVEVDEIQHGLNLKAAPVANLSFQRSGAEALPFEAASFDTVVMLKSLHHVPAQLMGQAFAEIRRVLAPEGRLYLSEPVFAGDLNEITRLFHDEQRVREQAIAAITAALAQGLFTRERQVNFFSPVRFASFADYRAKTIDVTHTEHRLDAALMARIEAAFAAHQSPTGARFVRPLRVDVLAPA